MEFATYFSSTRAFKQPIQRIKGMLALHHYEKPNLPIKHSWRDPMPSSKTKQSPFSIAEEASRYVGTVQTPRASSLSTLQAHPTVTWLLYCLYMGLGLASRKKRLVQKTTTMAILNARVKRSPPGGESLPISARNILSLRAPLQYECHKSQRTLL